MASSTTAPVCRVSSLKKLPRARAPLKSASYADAGDGRQPVRERLSSGIDARPRLVALLRASGEARPSSSSDWRSGARARPLALPARASAQRAGCRTRLRSWAISACSSSSCRDGPVRQSCVVQKRIASVVRFDGENEERRHGLGHDDEHRGGSAADGAARLTAGMGTRTTCARGRRRSPRREAEGRVAVRARETAPR